MAWEMVAEVRAFREALERFRRRVPMTDAAFNALLEASHQAAFTIARLTDLEMVTQVWESLDRAVRDGVPMDDWREEIESDLTTSWAGRVANPGARIETIYRNAVHTSFSHGRWEQMEDPDIKRLRPYRQFDAIRDSRTTDVCAQCDGTILPADDPWWSSHVPPLHHRCRSQVRALTRRRAEKLGVTTQAPADAPQQGFGDLPKPGQSHLREPDLAHTPQALRDAYQRKAARPG